MTGQPVGTPKHRDAYSNGGAYARWDVVRVLGGWEETDGLLPEYILMIDAASSEREGTASEGV